MKLKAGAVYAAYKTAAELAKEELPVKGKYWLGRIMKKLEPEFANIEERRNELIKKHGEEKEGQLQVPAGKIAYFMLDFNEVLSQDIDVEVLKVKLDMLGDGNTKVDLTPLEEFIDAT